MQEREEWCEILKCSENPLANLEFSALQIILQNADGIKTPRQTKLKEFVISRLALQEMFLREKSNDIGEKCRSTWRKEEHQRRNK